MAVRNLLVVAALVSIAAPPALATNGRRAPNRPTQRQRQALLHGQQPAHAAQPMRGPHAPQKQGAQTAKPKPQTKAPTKQQAKQQARQNSATNPNRRAGNRQAPVAQGTLKAGGGRFRKIV